MHTPGALAYAVESDPTASEPQVEQNTGKMSLQWELKQSPSRREEAVYLDTVPPGRCFSCGNSERVPRVSRNSEVYLDLQAAGRALNHAGELEKKF